MRALTPTRATLLLPVRAEPRSSRLPRRSSSGSAAATSPGSGCRGRAGALTVAGAPRARAACGQQEAAAAACGLFPPFINPAQGTDGGRGGTRLSDRRVLRRAKRQKENKRAGWSEPLVLRPRLDSGGELRWAGRCGGRAGAGGGLRRGVLRGAELGEAGQVQGTGLWALVKESPGWPPSSQGHLQASWAAPRGSLSAAPRRRAPAIWRHWEPRHPRVYPSLGGALALARSRGRARGGLGTGVASTLVGCGSEGSPSPSGVGSGRHSAGAFSSRPRLARARPPRGGVGGARLRADQASCRAPAAELCVPPRSRAEPSSARRVTPSPPARRSCAPPPPSSPAPFGPAPRLPRTRSSSHCSPAATEALSTSDL